MDGWMIKVQGISGGLGLPNHKPACRTYQAIFLQMFPAVKSFLSLNKCLSPKYPVSDQERGPHTVSTDLQFQFIKQLIITSCHICVSNLSVMIHPVKGKCTPGPLSVPRVCVHTCIPTYACTIDISMRTGSRRLFDSIIWLTGAGAEGGTARRRFAAREPAFSSAWQRKH